MSSIEVAKSRRSKRFRRVIVVGAGNIGSHALPLIARSLFGEELIVVDPDRYDQGNLVGQGIAPEDVGGNKAEVQARRLRHIRPDLQVTAIAQRIEETPLGRVADSVVACFTDNRSSRQTINQMAIRMGVPWVDAAVDGGNRQLRVNVYEPCKTACLECGWSDEDYAAVEQDYPCGAPQKAATTNSPASLGAIAGGLAALELVKILRGDRCNEAQELFMDVGNWQQQVSRLFRNPQCRSSHSRFHVDSLQFDTTIGNLLDRFPLHCRLGMEGQRFVRNLSCPNCRAVVRIPRLVRQLHIRRHDPSCPHCESPLIPRRGFDNAESLDLRSISKSLHLADLGLVPDDVVSLSNDNDTRHFQLLGDPS